MDEISELEAIQQELDRLSGKLGALFPDNHPKFNDVFEDIGAARYYIGEINYLIKSVVKTIQGEEKADDE